MFRGSRVGNLRVLVTGGAGFVGSHLCERLVADGNRVICIDNLATGSLGNIAQLMSGASFEFREHDVIEPIDIDVARIYNLACAASPERYQADPLQTFKTCVFGVLNSVELARNRKAKLLHTSTSEVYGEPHEHPQKESYWGHVNPIGVRSCYDEGKRAAETVIFDSLRLGGLSACVCRIFNTYGPKMGPFDGRVVSNFIRQTLTGGPLTIHGDGSQTRSFCYIDDLVEGICRLMDAPDTLTGPVNLGNPCEITVLELAETIRDLIGTSVEIELLPMPQDDPTRRCPDISMAKQVLDWQPAVPLTAGLSRTIDYFDNLIAAGGLEDYMPQSGAKEHAVR
ncbi:MAG: SDR family oxidoreductase [Proteobacteria bacterium]|nr:SDR family oxidoreductase [Pseudomonadota bacterium]